MFKKLLTTRSLCLSAIIAALYAALTLLLAPISYGPVQLRLSEAFTVLPMVLPQSIPGLFVGCLIANIFNPSPSIFDIVFGSLTTLLAAYGTYKLRNKPILAATCPVVANGLIVGTMVWALSHEFPPFRRNPAFVPRIPPFYFARLPAKYEKTVKIAKILSL